MPGFNGTGPQGYGPMTGRGLGPCGGGKSYGRGNRSFGRGFGFGRQGFSANAGYGASFSQPTKANQTANAKSYISDLKDELKQAEEYLKQLESSK